LKIRKCKWHTSFRLSETKRLTQLDKANYNAINLALAKKSINPEPYMPAASRHEMCALYVQNTVPLTMKEKNRKNKKSSFWG
jgi:hypothetical protein